LNTAYLQLTGDTYEKKLELDVKQFNVACCGDGPRWAREHDVCLLLTHHPPQWLRENKNGLCPEITRPGRFAVHLCGHLHEPAMRAVYSGGAQPLRLWQGASLFGLENWGDDRTQERLHGYSAGRIEVKDQNGFLRQWPRVAILRPGGDREVIPDFTYKLQYDDLGTNPEQIALNRTRPKRAESVSQQASIKPDLEELARTCDPQAMMELSLSASPRAFDVLSSVLKTSSQDKTREAAVHAIANLADDRKIPLLGEILVTEKWLVAAACAQALGRSGSNASIPYLIKALRLKVDWLVVQKSAEALGFLEPTGEVLRTLVRLLNEGSFEGEAAKQSLVTHGEVSIPALLDHLNRTVSYNGLILTIQALDAIGDRRAVPELQKIQSRIDGMSFEEQWKEKLKTAAANAIESIR
jgi:hypothetical protein